MPPIIHIGYASMLCWIQEYRTTLILPIKGGESQVSGTNIFGYKVRPRSLCFLFPGSTARLKDLLVRSKFDLSS